MIYVQELVDMVLMTLIVGFIFMFIINKEGKFTWKMFIFSALAIAPAIILHELGHKIVGILFGYTAVFHAEYMWLGIGVVLALMRSPIIFFVPAFVTISCATAACVDTPLARAAIAFAGPFVNLLLFFTALIVLKTHKDLSKKAFLFWHLTKIVNIFLFIFNMLPIPGFDGSKVFPAVIQAIF